MSNKKREFRTIDLPSGGKAEIYTYFDRNAEREIRRTSAKGIVIPTETTGKEVHTLDELTDMQIRKEDSIVLFGTRCIYDVDGTKTEMSNKVLDSMSTSDFRVIFEELEQVFLGKGKK